MNERELAKEKVEREILEVYMANASITDCDSIQKKVRPDFELVHKNGLIEGIEITRLTSSDQQVINSIIRENHGTTDNAGIVRRKALDRHGKKADKYSYYKIDDRLAVGSGIIDVIQNKREYAERICQKYSKYCNDMEKYDRFTILCDARWGIEITSDEDAKDVIDMIALHTFSHAFEVAILYYDDNQMQCFQYHIKEVQNDQL